MTGMRRRKRGIPVGDIGDVITGAVDAAGAGALILADPALPQIAGLIGQLHTAQQVPGQPETPGIGLGSLVLPLQLYVQYQQNPVVVGALALGLVIGLPMALGYYLAK
jgi:hypothetical protein